MAAKSRRFSRDQSPPFLLRMRPNLDHIRQDTELTNNQAEYLAIISVLQKYANSDDEIVIYSDSKNTVNQLNHEFAINNEQLRNLAREAWSIMAKFSNLKIIWVPRAENLAGKMLGS